MAMTINTNVVSINAQRNLGLSGSSLGTTMQRLSSGLRVNSAKDDAAGLAIAERMNAQSKGLAVAARNANDGISLAQTAEGALGKVGDMLQRMRELAVQSSNATNSAADREALQAEVSQLTAEIDRVAKTTSFNNMKILDGSFSGAVFQVGSNAGDNITVGALKNAKIDALGSIQVGSSSVEITKGTITELGEVADMSITVGDAGPVSLGTIAKASSEQERLGQVVAAINAKSADTGVTAFLETDEAGNSTLSLRSDSEKAVKLSGGTADSVGFEGGAAAIAAGTITKDTEHAAIEKAMEQTTVAAAKTEMDKALQAYGYTAAGGDTDWEDAKAAATTDAGLGALQTAFDAELKKIVVAEKDGDLDIEEVDAATVGMSSLSVTTQKDAWTAIKQIDSAIDQVNAARGDLGALQTRFEKTVENIDIQSENITAARGRIVDADFAVETANLSRSQILQQAGTAMVAQANQLPQQVLSLLQ